MENRRLPYDDAATPTQMAADCTQVGRELRLTVPRRHGSALHYPAGRRRGTPQVPDELAAMAGRLELHLG